MVIFIFLSPDGEGRHHDKAVQHGPVFESNFGLCVSLNLICINSCVSSPTVCQWIRKNMNYIVLIIGSSFIFSRLWYALNAKKWYQG